MDEWMQRCHFSVCSKWVNAKHTCSVWLYLKKKKKQSRAHTTKLMSVFFLSLQLSLNFCCCFCLLNKISSSLCFHFLCLICILRSEFIYMYIYVDILERKMWIGKWIYPIHIICLVACMLADCISNCVYTTMHMWACITLYTGHKHRCRHTANSTLMLVYNVSTILYTVQAVQMYGLKWASKQM